MDDGRWPYYNLRTYAVDHDNHVMLNPSTVAQGMLRSASSSQCNAVCSEMVRYAHHDSVSLRINRTRGAARTLH